MCFSVWQTSFGDNKDVHFNHQLNDMLCVLCSETFIHNNQELNSLTRHGAVNNRGTFHIVSIYRCSIFQYISKNFDFYSENFAVSLLVTIYSSTYKLLTILVLHHLWKYRQADHSMISSSKTCLFSFGKTTFSLNSYG